MKLFTHPRLWNRKLIGLSVLFILFAQMIFAQEQQPLIMATSDKVDIRDGEIYQKNVWNLSPGINPDIYYPLEPPTEKKITFYTDLDSISFNIVPGKRYSFIIVLNNKDTCYTQIATSKPVREMETNMASSKMLGPEMLKQDFTIFRDALQKQHAGLYRYKTKSDVDRLFDIEQRCLQLYLQLDFWQ